MQAASPTLAREEQVVILELDGDPYGIDIGKVQEIIRMKPITHVPNSPPFIEGVTNLRGRVVPVMDLRKRFGGAAREPTRRTRIVVVEIGPHTLGLIVDAVSEVLRVPADRVEPPSSLIAETESKLVRAVAKVDDRLVLLLDLEYLPSEVDRLDLDTVGADRTIEGRD